MPKKGVNVALGHGITQLAFERYLLIFGDGGHTELNLLAWRSSDRSNTQ